MKPVLKYSCAIAKIDSCLYTNFSFQFGVNGKKMRRALFLVGEGLNWSHVSA